MREHKYICGLHTYIHKNISTNSNEMRVCATTVYLLAENDQNLTHPETRKFSVLEYCTQITTVSLLMFVLNAGSHYLPPPMANMKKSSLEFTWQYRTPFYGISCHSNSAFQNPKNRKIFWCFEKHIHTHKHIDKFMHVFPLPYS